MHEFFIYSGTRTPFCKMGSSLASLKAADLAKESINALLNLTAIDPSEISETIFGCVGQPPESANLARVAALRAGIPRHIPAATVQRNCASGLEALTTAHQRFTAGHGDLFVVGGVESMSNYPLHFRKGTSEKFTQLVKAKTPLKRASILSTYRPKDFAPIVTLKLGLTDPVSGLNMGETAEILAREFEISRLEQDEFAAKSHQKAYENTSLRNEEITALFINGNVINSDNGLRADSSAEKLSKLKPVFDPTTGTVTAGNASQITDGAVALLAGSEEAGKRIGLTPIGKLLNYAYTGCDPARMGLGPIYAIEQANQRAQLSLQDADHIEINEAFSAQVLACHIAMTQEEYAIKAGLKSSLGELSLEQINPGGGSIALGHPVGATGARLVLTALKHLKQKGQKKALISLCIGGGQGAAAWLEAL